ncbi:hypothetical protein LDENG_00135920, partial [Lucifuga dentata]
EKLFHAFISSRLDCNLLYIGVNQSSLNRLQLVQNATAQLLMCTHKSFNGLAPPYLSDLLCPHTSSRSLRSTNQMLLAVPRSRFKLKGDHAFAVAAPKWNGIAYLSTLGLHHD